MKKQNPANFSFYSPMSIDIKIKLITYLVACGVGIGVPLFVGSTIALMTGNPYFLLFVLPFLGINYLAWIYAPYAVAIDKGKLQILRRIGPVVIELGQIKKAKKFERLCDEAGWVLRTWGSGGAWGIYGSFWSKKWGHFKMHVTKDRGYVLLELEDGKKIVVSPDHRDALIKKLGNQLIQ